MVRYSSTGRLSLKLAIMGLFENYLENHWGRKAQIYMKAS
jgi:hypothetical protein